MNTKISLEYGVHRNSDLFRLQRGSVLKIHPGLSLLGKRVSVFCNYPVRGKPFDRSVYQKLQWITDKDIGGSNYNFIDNVACYCMVHAEQAGSFNIYFSCEEKGKDVPNCGSLYILVEPKIKVGASNDPIILQTDAIRCQTVLAKLLGPLDTWVAKLRVSKESGYNMIHFTPIQALGESRSCYSLCDQLKVNPSFSTDIKNMATFDDVAKIITQVKKEWNMASICDIVLNHTANESEWLKKHPECTYSCNTCPHLRPAFLLDALLTQVSNIVDAGLLEFQNVPKIIENEDHLNALRHQLFTVYLPKIQLQDFYQCDIEAYVTKFGEEIRSRPPPNQSLEKTHKNGLSFLQDPEFRRLATKIDFELALEIYNIFWPDCFDEETRIRKCTEEFRAKLEELNNHVAGEIQNSLNSAIENCLAGVRYERIQCDGPLVKEISKRYPLFQTYFTKNGTENLQLKQIEKMMYEDAGKFFMAHNGWVMNGDPLNDFAKFSPGIGNVYLKRELIAWGDSVKLRYGEKPEDCPYLWEHMKNYVNTTAKIFNGVRLDNCHSTPIHVAQYLLDEARKVNPELFIVAELFTNSDMTDNIFVNQLGITSLIREAQSAWDSHEEGRLVYRYGGIPVGGFYSSSKQSLAPKIAHAMFLDQTHDNPSPVEKRSVFDLLPSGALVAMACCATGSNRGYDELVPHHIHVVDEERQYQEWRKHVTSETGIIAAKNAINRLHGELAEQGFNQVFVDQMSTDIVAVTRHSPETHESVILVAYTSFGYPDPCADPVNPGKLRFEGNLQEIIFEATVGHRAGRRFDRPFSYKKDEHFVNGIDEYSVKLSEHIKLNESDIFRKTPILDQNYTELEFENFYPGSVVAIKVAISETKLNYIQKLKDLKLQLETKQGYQIAELKGIISKMDLLQLNRSLYTCDAEERDLGFGSSAYEIPGFGSLVYCGLQGIVSVLADITPFNDLGHPLCNNLREGNWLIDYVYHRLKNINGTEYLGLWLEKHLALLKGIPRYLIPSYFDVLIRGVHEELVNHAIHLMSEFVRKSGSLVHSMSLGSVQMIARCNSAIYPIPTQAAIAENLFENIGTLAAGLPHFATGYMRCWGRDTFIALRGLTTLCGRTEETRYIILSFASTLRHGLIPNLLDSGTKPRFNCRDAVWWWLSSVKDYVDEVENGKDILHEKVFRYFPSDESDLKKPGECVQFLYEIIKEALTAHFQGLVFTERNAGSTIDAHMKMKGFHIQIGTDPETGFVFGGNDANCGTWMDKMGSSDKAGNRGNPSTPRDGTAIELVGLQYSVLVFLNKMSDERQIPFGFVERTSQKGVRTIWTFKEWAERIKDNFEKHFFVDEYTIGKHVNKRGIYKDSFNATAPWTDFQLRCNFPIAMVSAPDLFNPQHAWQALEMAKKHLLGPLGMRTLDPEDYQYRGNYDNSNDSDDNTVAHGANYHQGPEWLWPIGYYLRARLIFAAKLDKLPETIEETWNILGPHFQEVNKSHWRGLPELTNANGAFCRDSCATQAWSMATILEVLYDLHKIQKNK